MLRDWVLAVAPGPGVVSRTRSTVLVVPDTGAAGIISKLQRVIAAHEERASSEGASSRRLIRDLATVFAEEEELPAFGLVTEHSGSLALLVHGSISARIGAPGGQVEEVSGLHSQTWVDRILSEPPTELVLGTPPPPIDGVAFDLRDGTVPGAGACFRPLSAAPDPLPIPPPKAAADPPPAAPSPAPPPAPSLPDDSEVLVRGVMCARGHFNRPTVSYCSVCGTSMQHLTLRPVDGPRPALGVLVLPDGSVVTVDRDLVIGREPAVHPDVAAGRARGVSVDDPDLTVSRAHAVVRLHDWEVRVQDNGSSNGTRLQAPGADEVIELHGDVEISVTAGTAIMLGSFRMTFNSSLH